jgi:CDP-diacylglycerol--serine O-phosphatidyltransferase
MKNNKGINKEKTKMNNIPDTLNKSIKSNTQRTSKKEALKNSALAKYIPSAITISSMCFGLTSIKFAQDNNLIYAVLYILGSALFDMFDGKIARFLEQSSAFGLELDSLSDLVCFGVAPSLVLYLASMKQFGIIGWVICMFYTSCCALRLARFNVSHADYEHLSILDRKYFVGIPAPVGAIVALFPLYLYLETKNSVIISPLYGALFLLFSGCMMVSTIRTFSSKIFELNIISKWVILAGGALAITCLAIRFWMSVSIMVIIYLLTIPYAVYRYSKAIKTEKSKK